MSRHRIVRTMDYKDEYDSYDDVYGHSVDDDNCISPTDASQWIYDRAKGQQSISAFMANHRNIEEEDEDKCSDIDNDDGEEKKRRDSENYQMPVLDDIEQAKLLSCIDEIRSVVGDTISERQIVETAMKYDYDVAKTLDSILNTTSTPPSAGPPTKSLKNISIGSEKDFKNNLFEKDSEIKSELNVNKLNELLKNNLKVSNTSSGVNRSGFILPKLNLDNLQTSKTNANSSSKLSQFINSKLNKTNNVGETSTTAITTLKTGFGLRNVNTNVSNSPSSPSKRSEFSLKDFVQKSKLSKIGNNENISAKQTISSLNEFSREENDKVSESRKVFVDLSKVLCEGNEKNEVIPSHQQKSKPKELFFIPFIDCDISPLQLDTNQCEVDLSHVINKNESNFFAKPSNFAKIINLRYKCKGMPYIKHRFISKHQPKPFNFDSKSPDDLVSEFRKNTPIN